MDICLDCETTGLPIFSGEKRRGYPKYTDLSKYDTSRLVSLSWIVSQNGTVIQQAYYVVKPDTFEVTAESTAIHGISHEEALKTGNCITNVLNELKKAMMQCKNVVAHNVEFDINIIKSELFRYNYIDVIDHISDMHHICTMKKGKELMKVQRVPKLAALYKHLYNEDITNAHNAMYDTYYCFKCFIKMFPADENLFFFGNKEVNLTEEQKQIVFEDLDKNILAIASAGSGKTTTTLCRIKHLINNGVAEESILLTTFTRDAANDMKNKLFDIMGYKPNITCGTIDSIAKMYTERLCADDSLKHVSEYGFNFYNLIEKDPSVIKKYRYMFVDEFQDINDIQFKIIKAFYTQGVKVFVVGDDAQNIYTFRGSNITYILNFDTFFENAVMHKLTYNFRSTRQIINLANAVIENNQNQIPKKMVSGTQQDGDLPVVQYFDNSRSQNEEIVQRIVALIEDGVCEDEIAILSPVNQSLYIIEELLTKRGVKNVYLDGKSDVRTSKKPGHVCMCTIHKAKGLEWDVVFFINVSDDIIPKMKNPKSIEEDRRLFYVSVTRARNRLYMYYSKGFGDSKFVSRYIGEVDRKLVRCVNMMPNYFVGQSDTSVCDIDMSVTKLVELLDGEDYIKLKQDGVIPPIDNLVKTKLYESFAYKPFIEKDDLYSDFGIFMEKFITREIGMNLQEDKLLVDRHACQCLANLKLEPQQFEIYNQYKHNFKTNLKDVEPFIANLPYTSSSVKDILQRNSKFINHAHLPVLVKILQMIHTNAVKYGISITEIPVFNCRFLPDGFEDRMKVHFANFKDLSRDYKTALKDIWSVSKCKKIVTEYRRRLLYKQVAWDEFTSYEPLFENIHTKMMAFLNGMMNANKDVACEEKLRIEEGMFGELDLRLSDTIIDYKTSVNDELNMNWLLQLLCYKVLADFNQKKINKIGILNPLKGWYIDIDVSKWDKHHQLVEYLLQKRQQKLSMT
jgi:DNA polymerase III epsilon subunit-like protein